MIGPIRKIFAPEPHVPRLPDPEIKRKYPIMRWRVLEATFLGYAMYYLVRDNIKFATGGMQDVLGYSKEDLGLIMGVTAITYGLGKFLMGAVSDRSNPRVFIAFGLLLSSLLNFSFAGVAHLGLSLNALFTVHMVVWGVNGFVQGMGWPPCGRSMGHWYSENERGLTFSIWNTSHNLGGGIAGILAAYAVQHYGGWEYAFVLPGIITAFGSIYLFMRLVDTPQSQGLPSIEEYRNDYPKNHKEGVDHERELTYKELFLNYVLLNKFVWILAIANFFAYIARYAMLDWGPTYLQEVKNVSITHSGFVAVALEFGGIPSTIALGYLSDRLGGRRGMVAVLAMIPIIIAYALFPFVPATAEWLDYLLLFIVGFCIYPVINFITIMALDLTSKKAIGVAAGFIGLFGYLGKAINSWWAGRAVDTYTDVLGAKAAWDIPLWTAMGCSVIAMFCLLLTWNQRPKA